METLTKKKVAVDIVEITDGKEAADAEARRFCYTKALLKSVLQLMGCKTRVAHKAAKAVFQELGRATEVASTADANPTPGGQSPGGNPQVGTPPGGSPRSKTVLTRADFHARVMAAVRELTDKPPGDVDLQIACSIREQQRCIILMFSGTSGTGKSTLAGLLAAKMGITTVVSTDSIRHMLRSFSSEEEDPLLWASTYQAGDLIPQAASPAASLDSRLRAIQGYKAQCDPVVERVERLVARCEARNESLVLEGVHLSINAVVRIMDKHPCVLPFLVYISNETKHRERFAVRAKYMTLDPGANRYVKHLRQIRVIQSYLVKRADRHCIPRVDNTNVDRSVAAIHATVLSCLRRQSRGEEILDRVTKLTMPLAEDYEQSKRDTWSSKSMLQFIRSRKSAAIEGAEDACEQSEEPPV